MSAPAPMSVNALMERAAAGDASAINVLDMIDADECGARAAGDEQLGVWYAAGAAA